MKKIKIFEPAMCCSTGVCGPSIDQELLRMSTVITVLKKNGIEVERFNLTNAPDEFIKNKVVNDYINLTGVDNLPVTIVDDEIILTKRYPTNEELAKLLDISLDLLKDEKKNSCCCNGKC